MTTDFDVEGALGRFRHEPSARVKRSVMTAFRHTFRGGDRGGRRVRFWRRPVPLYAAAATLLVLVGLSFALGRTTSRAGGSQSGLSPERPGGKNVVTSQDMNWVAAENDVL
jgi:hypothetical protein